MTKSRVGRRVSNERGQSLVEIALITPLLLIALYIPIDLGILFYTSHLAQNAGREGARIAAATDSLVDSNCSMASTCGSVPAGSVLAAVRDRMPAYLQNATIGVDITDGTGCMRTVTVTVSGTYPFGFARLVGLTTPLTVTRSTEVRYEDQPFGNSVKC